jgi:hypothetical protein
MKYNPLVEPDPERWLETDEPERLHVVLAYHRQAGIKLPDEFLHAAIHTTVENQAALGGETPVAQALERLVNQGLDRHDAIHAIGSVLADHIWELMSRGDSEVTDPNVVYFREIRALTAQKWLDNQG